MGFNLICGFGFEPQDGHKIIFKKQDTFAKYELGIDSRIFELVEDLEML